ncbi:mitochondrial import receptor protein [Puttea exsequens]|nr:mitochondrial import receptor protein [Puttea exsequens]
MVQLEEVEDQDLDQAQTGPIDDTYDSADYEDTDSELSDDDDVAITPQESLSDRILALRDIIPPRTRRFLSSTLNTTFSASKSAAWLGGKGLWVFSTGALMLMVPFAMATVEEQQFVEQEKMEKAREGTSEIVMPGGGGQGVGSVRGL